MEELDHAHDRLLGLFATRCPVRRLLIHVSSRRSCSECEANFVSVVCFITEILVEGSWHDYL